jgi:uncharacterized protein YndB with AHSA1/START domain
MADYTFLTDWQVDASRERVWDTLLDVRRWPTWWPGFRSVEVLDPGGDSGVGTVLRQQWRSLVPYTLTLELEILTVERGRRLVGRVSGDLLGRATWTLDEQDGETVVRFMMEVTPARAWMRLPLPFAGRIIAANYAAIMRWGGQGLARVVGRRVIESTTRLTLQAA